MDFDQMLEIWRAQDTGPQYDVNRDALRRALQAEEARLLRSHRLRSRGRWLCGIFGAGMVVWAAFWIAITISNGWPAIYVITAAASLAMFGIGVGAMWAGRARRAEPEPKFGNALHEEVKRSLALVDHELSIMRQWIMPIGRAAFIVFGALLFSWTLTRSQNIPEPSSGAWWNVSLAIFFVWVAFKAHSDVRTARPKLETRQQRLRKLLATLDAHQ